MAQHTFGSWAVDLYCDLRPIDCHDIDDTWGSCRLKSPASRLFGQQPFQYDIKKNIVLNYCPFVTGIYRWPVKQKGPLSWLHHTLMLSSLHRHGSLLGSPDRYGEVRHTDILTKLKQLSIITKDIITIAGISGTNCPIQEEIFQLQIEFHEIQVLQDSCCQSFQIWQRLYYYVIQCAVDISRSFFFV